MKIHCEFLNNLKGTAVYEFYTQSLGELKNEFFSLGHSEGFTNAIILKYDNEYSEVMWIEDSGTVLGIVVFGEKTDFGKGIVTLHLFRTLLSEPLTLFREFETMVKKRGYRRISFLTSVKDQKNIEVLESNGMNKEYFHLFKKIK